jgi:hypothetical protein
VLSPVSSENVMSMPGSWRSLALVVFLSVFTGLLLSCAKNPLQVDRNRPPTTFLVAAPIDSSVADLSYSYRLHLYWRGEDADGYVVGFLWSWDDSSIGAFHFTTKTDSIFEVTVNDSTQLTGGTGTNPGNAKAHSFFIRAVDNRGKADPSLTRFNARAFTAQTNPPTVSFISGTGLIPSLDGSVEIDTLCDGAPFKVSWYGRDTDGVVTRYRFDVGTYNSPLSTDSVAYFNDPSHPGSVSLSSGLYTLSVSAIDNANAVGRNSIQFVINRDPETWFLDAGGGRGSPVGYYNQHWLEGQLVNIVSTFAPGDTVPYRSTVWWKWDGEDIGDGPLPKDGQGNIIGPRRPDHCETSSLEPNGRLTGWSFVLQPGTRDGNNPYIIGFLDTLTVGPPLVRFNNNDPGPLGRAGFTTLILDSLDAGIDMIARVASRDGSNRADGTPASFVFNCNFPPHITGLSVTDTLANPDGIRDSTGTLVNEPCKYIAWTSEDYEDGLATFADVKLDDSLTKQTEKQVQSLIVANRVFRALSSGPNHTVKVRVKDRAEIQSQPPVADITFTFNLPAPRP